MPCHMEGPFPMPCHMADSRQYDPCVHCHISVTYIYSFSPFPPSHCVIEYLITYDMYFRLSGFSEHVSYTDIHLVYIMLRRVYNSIYFRKLSQSMKKLDGGIMHMYPSYTSIYHAIPSYDGISRYMSGYQGVRIPDNPIKLIFQVLSHRVGILVWHPSKLPIHKMSLYIRGDCFLKRYTVLKMAVVYDKYKPYAWYMSRFFMFFNQLCFY